MAKREGATAAPIDQTSAVNVHLANPLGESEVGYVASTVTTRNDLANKEVAHTWVSRFGYRDTPSDTADNLGTKGWATPYGYAGDGPSDSESADNLGGDWVTPFGYE
jgi:hypothetical protein